eukprot:TRINITY_DN9454_c0_g3_i1.p1 TRINITY_DN9454_c0_g3~~TRINITY_DN9454_c0_g3_i1.p1  ORF type:complete len:553 (+),score=96.85 TRINITY_DN9454_c0_g3_i1:60-1661(+)
MAADLPMPTGSSEGVAGDILLENASRFAARIGSSTGFAQPLRTPAGRRTERIVGLGNPLLDLSTSVDLAFLKKYELDPNGACVCTDTHEGVFEFLKHEANVTFVPGGSCLNTLRVAQWLTKHAGATTYLGTVGLDAYGEDLRREAQVEGLEFPKLAHPELSTGTCAVLICDQDRSLIANLGASCHFNDSILESNPEVTNAIAAAGVFYIEGFFFNASPGAVYKLAAHAAREYKIFALNMSAEFVPHVHKAHFQRLLPYTHYLFGNGAEGRAFADAMGWDLAELVDAVKPKLERLMTTVDEATTTTAAIAVKMSTLRLHDDLRVRTVVLTQGKDPTVVATRGYIALFTPPVIDSHDIVDTNGSGDAFVGGFIARLAAGACLSECVYFGHRSAKELLKTSGCTLPECTELMAELRDLDDFGTGQAADHRYSIASSKSNASTDVKGTPTIKCATFADDEEGGFGNFSKLPYRNGGFGTPELDPSGAPAPRTRSLSLSASAQTVMTMMEDQVQQASPPRAATHTSMKQRATRRAWEG